MFCISTKQRPLLLLNEKSSHRNVQSRKTGGGSTRITYVLKAHNNEKSPKPSPNSPIKSIPLHERIQQQVKSIICGASLSALLLFSSSSQAASILTFPVAERPDLFAVQKTLVEAWTIVSATYVDPTYNHLQWEDELSSALNTVAHARSVDDASQRIKTMVGKLGDPFTRWVEQEEYNSFRVSSDGELEGVGLLIAQDPNSGRLLVLAPIKGSPADRAGIQPGDEVLSVDGTSTEGWNGEEAARVLRGEQGSSVMVEVARRHYTTNTTTTESDDAINTTTTTTTTMLKSANDSTNAFVPGVVSPRPDKVEYKRFRLRRERVEISPVFATAMHYDDHTFGYLRLVNFSQHAATEMEKAIKQLKRDGAESFILDLRNNPGGLVKSSLEIASLWLNGDTRPTIFSIEDRGDAVVEDSSSSAAAMTTTNALQKNVSSTTTMNTTTHTDDNDDDTNTNSSSVSRVQRIVLNGGRAATDLPLVVLVNGQSASASEILAGALHDNNRAEIIGDRTFGKGKIQSVFELGDGSALFVTVAKYRTPSGADIDTVGIMPDKSCSLNAVETTMNNNRPRPASVPGIPVGIGADEQVLEELETDDCVLTAEALLDEKVDVMNNGGGGGGGGGGHHV